MTKEEYKKLNGYYNDLCLGLSINDSLFLKNIHSIGALSSEMLMLFESIELKDEKKDDCFTFFEIYNKAREVLSDIEPKYLDMYDKMIDDGTIGANYEVLDIPYLQRKLGDSSYNPNNSSIDISSSFNYDMISILIHEFFHKINFSKTKARYLLTEYISIYFELYTYEYLKRQGIDVNNFELQIRLKEFKKNAEFLSENTYFIYYFENYGNLDENSYKNMPELDVTKEEYEECLQEELKHFEKIEDNYKNIYSKRYDSFTKYLVNFYKDDYRYFIGTLLAYYSIYNISKDKVLQLNENLKNNMEFTFEDAINMLGIDLNKKDFDIELSEILVRYMNENGLIKNGILVKQ